MSATCLKKLESHCTDKEYNRSTAKKRAAIRKGKQFSKQPEDVAKKNCTTQTMSFDSTTQISDAELEQIVY